MNLDGLFTDPQPNPSHALSAAGAKGLGRFSWSCVWGQRAPRDGAPVVMPDGAGGDVAFFHSQDQSVGAVRPDSSAQYVDAGVYWVDGLFCPFWQQQKTQIISHSLLLVGTNSERIFYLAARPDNV